MARKPKPKTFSAEVDGRIYTLELDGDPAAPMTDSRSYAVMREGEKVATVRASGTSMYYVCRGPAGGNHVGYVQHNRDEAIWSAALLVSRGLPPPKPRGVAWLHEIAGSSGSVAGSRADGTGTD